MVYLWLEDDFLMNLFTSKSNARELEHQMINIWRIATAMVSRKLQDVIRYDIPHALGLSGTPLNESLIALHTIIPQFQKENGVEKVQCVILTDGEAHGVPAYKT